MNYNYFNLFLTDIFNYHTQYDNIFLEIGISLLYIILFSLIQGFTEFIPVSSSSHLIIISKFLDFTKENLLTNISLHIGSFLAVLVYFRNEILNYIKYKKILILIIIASTPVIILGYFLVKLEVIDYLRGMKIIGWTTIIFGILLYISDRFKVQMKEKTS